MCRAIWEQVPFMQMDVESLVLRQAQEPPTWVLTNKSVDESFTELVEVVEAKNIVLATGYQSVIAAVLASGERDINEIAKKVSALNDIVSADTFKEQFSTFKRVANISKDVDLESELSIDTALFKEDAEVTLYNAYEKVINQDYADYKTQFEALFGLKCELDGYFDDVMVNAEDEALKKNRLNTIGSVYKTFKGIADIKEITV